MSEILFLCHRVPWPPNRGDKIRSFHILRALIALAPVHLACFDDADGMGKEPDDLAQSLASTNILEQPMPLWLTGLKALVQGKPVSLTAFDSDQLRDSIAQTIAEKNISCIFVFSGQMAQYVPDDFDGRVVMDFVDVDSAKFDSYALTGNPLMRWIYRREGQLLSAFEKESANRADHAIFVSEAEADLFRRRTAIRSDKIRAMGNGIDIEYYDPAKVDGLARETGASRILFTGQMDYPPNIEAVNSFCREAMPIVRQAYPDAQFQIVGRAPTAEVRKLDGLNGTQVIGPVEDIRSWLKTADLVVAPLRLARGVQNKVLEAMAMGKAVVASDAAAQGIPANSGQHLMIAESVGEEAELVRQLLGDTVLAERLGTAASDLVRHSHRWSDQLSCLPELCGLESAVLAEAAE